MLQIGSYNENMQIEVNIDHDLVRTMQFSTSQSLFLKLIGVTANSTAVTSALLMTQYYVTHVQYFKGFYVNRTKYVNAFIK